MAGTGRQGTGRSADYLGERDSSVTGGVTTDAFVEVFTHTNAKGLFTLGFLRNSGGTSMDVQQTATDLFGVTDSFISTITSLNGSQLGATTSISTAFPPFTSHKLEVRSTVPGLPTTYNLRFASMGAE